MPKFRAWDKMNKEMCDVWQIDFRDDYCDEILLSDDFDGAWSTFDDVFLMQSTSFKDADDADIFEGDIVKIDDDSNGEMKAKVVFEQGAFGLVGIDKKVSDIVNSNWNDDFLSMAYFSWEYEHPEDYLCNVVIIGNIYENPELLEVAE